MTKPIIRVLLLSKYEALGASSRLRALQFLPHLASQGFSVDVVPFLDNSYIESVQFGRRAFRSIVSGYVRRIASLLMRKRYDLVWVEKDFLPWVPKAVEDMLLDSTVNYVVDYDDAVFHQYDMHEHAWVRRLLATKIDLTMRNAAVVIAGNSYLAQRAIAAGARRVEIVPTVVDVGRYITSSEPTGAPFCVGWIGQGSTVHYLKLIEPTLRALYAEHPVTLRVVGPANWYSSSCPFQLCAWSEETEAGEISRMDVGVMPLRDDHWERGKCGYKIIQYMAAGKAVVASPVGVNSEIVDDGITGFLAGTENQWLSLLRELRDDAALRKKMGDAGRQKVEREYSLHVTAPRLAAILRSAAQ